MNESKDICETCGVIGELEGHECMNQDTYTPKQLKQIEGEFRATYANPDGPTVSSIWVSIKARLTAPEQEPAITGFAGQVYFYPLDNMNGGGYTKFAEDRKLIRDERSLTPREAGPECMKHLLDALGWVVECSRAEVVNPNVLKAFVKKALTKHLELIK